MPRLPIGITAALLAFLTSLASAGNGRETRPGQFPAGWRQRQPIQAGGKAFFPIGIFTSTRPWYGPQWREFAANGLNTVLAQWGDPKITMPMAKEAGLHVIMGVDGYAPKDVLADDKKFRQQRKEIEGRIAATVRTCSGYDNFLGIFTFDEPENLLWGPTKGRWTKGPDAGGFASFVRSRADWARRAVKKAAPDCPVWLILSWHNMFAPLSSGGDIVWTDLYVLNRKVDRPIQMVPKIVRKMYQDFYGPGGVESKRPGQAPVLIFTPQTAANFPRFRMPTEREFRYMAYAPITQGAMGLIWWSEFTAGDSEIRLRLYPMAAELKFVTPYLLGQWKDRQVTMSHTPLTTGKPPRVELDKDVKGLDELIQLPDISYIYRQCALGRLLVAVNNTYQTQQVKFTIAGQAGKKHVRIYGKARQSTPLWISDGVIEDKIEPIGVRVYLF